MLALYLLLILIALLLLHQLWWRRRGFPPGPFPLPLLGNALQALPTDSMSVRDQIHKMFLKYPRIYTLWLGPIPMVMVNDYELIKEHMIKHGDVYAGRPRNSLQEKIRNGRYGIMMTDGDQWKEQRRFSLHVLRDFGFGRNIMEERILQEVRHIIQNIQSEIQKGNGVVEDIHRPIQTCIGNIINAVLFGKRFPTGDEVHYIKSALDEGQKLGESPLFLLLFVDWTRKLPFVSHIWRAFDKMCATIWDFFDKQFEEHKKTYDPLEEPDNFVSAYLKEMDGRREKGEDMGYFCDAQLKATIFDIWLAGLSTTVDTLHWAFLYMIQYPEVQQKIQEEIDTVIGADAEIVYTDRTRLTYTAATIQELQRHINLIPMNVFRCAHEPVVIDGYRIEPGTYIIPQVGSVMHDERFFPNENKFNPDRFVDAGGELLLKPDQLMPFSVGKRQCLGESLARMELFMIFANILQRFEFDKVPGEPFPSLFPKKQFNVQPREYQCMVTERK